MQGVYRGSGRQKTGAVLNMIGCYLVGLPIGIPLALVGKQGVKGRQSDRGYCMHITLCCLLFRIVDWNVLWDISHGKCTGSSQVVFGNMYDKC